MADRSFALLTEAILERDQPRTADLFFRMVTRAGRALSDALDVVTRAEAPFVQVPSHINVRDGQITLTDGQHPFDYCNTANDWLRRTQSPYQARVLYLMANFVNDSARSNKLVTPVLERECAGFDATGRTPSALLQELDEAILAFDVPRTTALADAYLKSGADRRAYLASVAVTACKFQEDPHNQKITHSTFEEYAHSSSHLRDRLLLASARLLAGWPKMPGERDCYARFVKEWINN